MNTSEQTPKDTAKARGGAYASSVEHLKDELRRVDLLVRAQVFRARQEGDELRGLSISDDDVDEMLERSIGKARWESAEPPLALADINTAIQKRAKTIARRRGYSKKKGVELRLDALASRFELDQFETDVLLLALAPELDTRYGRLFGYLHDDITRSKLSVELALALLIPTFEARLAARRHFLSNARLIHHGLIKIQADPPEREAPLIRCSLKVDSRIVNYLTGIDAIEPPLSGRARRIVPRALLQTLLIPDSLKRLLTRLAEEREQSSQARDVLYLRGSYGVGKQSMAEALAAPDISERELETAIISNLQHFLLEFGKGFSFVGRQFRISTETSHFYIDLVFYNYLLKCFVLIDLKTEKLTHQAIGQMDMYVRMFDDLKRGEDDNPTVGIIFCTAKDETVVKYSVLKDSEQLFASKYRLILPTEEELAAEIERERRMIMERRAAYRAN